MPDSISVSVQTESARGASFHEAAATAHYERNNIPFEMVAYPTHQAQIDALLGGETQEAVIAVDNTTSGRVGSAISAIRDTNLSAVGVEVHRVNQHKIWVPGADPMAAEIVKSQRPAIEQCLTSIARDGYQPVMGQDTFGSVVELREGKGIIDGLPAVAIASAAAAELLDMEYDPRPYQDNPQNATKFWILRNGAPNQTGTHTALTFEVPDRSGALRDAIGIISVQHGLDLTDIDSHLAPSDTDKRAFFVEVEHRDADNPEELVKDLGLQGFSPRVMGTYTPHMPADLSSFDITQTNHTMPSALKHDEWNGREGLDLPEDATRLYVETDNRHGALYTVLGHLAQVNIVDMGRPTVTSGKLFHRGFYFVLDGQTPPELIQDAIGNIKDSQYEVEEV